MARVELAHERVAVHLRHDRGGGDRAVARVAADERRLRRRDRAGSCARRRARGRARTASPITARRIASSLAPQHVQAVHLVRRRAPRRTTATAWRADLARRAPRAAAAVSCFESSRPGSRTRAGSTTAAATSGPASGPTPTSSTPATRRAPAREEPRAAARTAARRAASRGAARRGARSSTRRERARAAARVAPQQRAASGASRAGATPSASCARSSASDARRLGIARRSLRSRLRRPRSPPRARSSARTRRSSSGRRESAAISRWKARSSALRRTRARARPPAHPCVRRDCGPMNALSPICLWPAMPACASITTPVSSTVEPAMPACATIDAALADRAVVSDLHEVVDLGAAADPRVAERAAVDGRVGADLDVVLDPRRARRCGPWRARRPPAPT